MKWVSVEDDALLCYCLDISPDTDYTLPIPLSFKFISGIKLNKMNPKNWL